MSTRGDKDLPEELRSILDRITLMGINPSQLDELILRQDAYDLLDDIRGMIEKNLGSRPEIRI